ncbi:MAG: helix-turn-helix transcriptional regulator [Mariniphaga sp.]
MNNHTNQIIVICNSDIILKGLADILTGCLSDEVLLLHQTNELIDYPHLSGYVLLIMPLAEFKENESFLKRVLNNINEIKHVQLIYAEKPEVANTAIYIHDNRSLIVNKVNELLNSFGAKNNDKTVTELTKREIDVLQLVAKGLANKEVADKLCISIHTVISHRKNISEKTGIKSASGLTMYAVLKKIIDIDEISTSDLI